MNLFNLMATLSLSSTNFNSGIDSAGKKASGFGTLIKKLALPAMMVSFGKSSLDAGMNFEASMSQVAATMGLTADEIDSGSDAFEALEAAAKKAGSETQFSATDSAEALNYLALAGYSVEDAVNTLPTVLNLAAAGNMGLAEASDMVTDSMSALSLDTKDANKFVDQLAKTSQKSNTSVAQLGQGILTVGGTAKILSGGTVELNAQLGILADNGIKGAEGGTALRNMILSLSSPTDKAAAQMKKLGLEVFDANGNMRSTNDIFGDLNTKLADMNDQERTEVLSNIFNKVDLKSANALLEGSGERFEELSKQIENSDGAAADMAETMNNNLKGAITSLQSALEGVSIAIYQKFNKSLTEGVKVITGFVRELGTIIDESENLSEFMPKLFQLIAKGLAQGIAALVVSLPQLISFGAELIYSIIKGIAFAIPTLVIEFVKLIPAMIIGIAKELPNLIIQGTKLILALIAGLVIGIPLIVEAAPHVIMMFVNSFINRISIMLQVGAMIIPALIQGILLALPWLIQNAIELVDKFAESLISKAPTVLDNGVKILTSIVDGIVQALPLLLDMALTIIDKMLEVFTTNLPKILDAGVTLLNKLVEGILNSLPTLIDAAFEAITKFVQTLLENFPTILQKGKEIITNLVSGIKDKLPDIASSIRTGVVNFLNVIIDNLPAVLKAGADLLWELIKGIVQIVPDLLAEGANTTIAVAKAFMDGLPAFLDIGKDIVKGVWNGITSMGSWMVDKVKGFFGGIVDGAKSALGIHSPSRVMAKEVGKWIPAGVEVGIEKEMPSLNKMVDEEFSNLANIDLNKNVKFDSYSNPNDSNSKEVTININNPRLTAEEQARELKNTEIKLMLGYL